MPGKTSKTIQVSVRVPVDMIPRIDAIAGRVGITRSQLITNFIGMGLDDAEILDAVGVFRLINAYREGKRRLRGADTITLEPT